MISFFHPIINRVKGLIPGVRARYTLSRSRVKVSHHRLYGTKKKVIVKNRFGDDNNNILLGLKSKLIRSQCTNTQSSTLYSARQKLHS